MAATSAVKHKPESAFEVLAKLAHTDCVRTIGYKNPLMGEEVITADLVRQHFRRQVWAGVAEFRNYLSASSAAEQAAEPPRL
jgi:hypothetical protein